MEYKYLKVLEEIARSAEETSGIPAYPRTVLNVLASIRLASDVFWITRYAREAFNLVVAVISGLHERGMISFVDGKIVLTERGKAILEGLGYEIRQNICNVCKGRRILTDILPDDVIKEFIKIQEKRPSPVRQYDQGYVTPETTLARVAYMYHRGDLKGREIIMLGDDDLVSIAIGLVGVARRVAVIDIDERLTSFISSVSREYGLDIEVLKLDLREPIPEDIEGKFDVFQTDPLETVPGFRAFVGRGIATLKGPRCAGYFYITLVDSSLDKWRDIQRILVEEFRVVITDVVPEFSEYVNWGYFEEMHGWRILPEKIRVLPRNGWYTSTMFRIETLRGSRGYREEIKDSKELYEDIELASA